MSRSTGGKKSASANTKTPAKNNASILNFFKKVDTPVKEKDDSIFMSQSARSGNNGFLQRQRERVESPGFDAGELGLEEDLDLYGDGVEGRFNESAGSVKRRKTCTLGDMEIADSEAEESQLSMFRPEVEVVDMADETEEERACTPPPPPPQPQPQVKVKTKKKRRTGPF